MVYEGEVLIRSVQLDFPVAVFKPFRQIALLLKRKIGITTEVITLIIPM